MCNGKRETYKLIFNEGLNNAGVKVMTIFWELRNLMYLGFLHTHSYFPWENVDPFSIYFTGQCCQYQFSPLLSSHLKDSIHTSLWWWAPNPLYCEIALSEVVCAQLYFSVRWSVLILGSAIYLQILLMHFCTTRQLDGVFFCLLWIEIQTNGD